VQNGRGYYLNHFLVWVPCDDVKDAFVHSAEDLELVAHKLIDGKIACEKENSYWTGPEQITPARWSKDTGTEICGESKKWTL